MRMVKLPTARVGTTSYKDRKEYSILTKQPVNNFGCIPMIDLNTCLIRGSLVPPLSTQMERCMLLGPKVT